MPIERKLAAEVGDKDGIEVRFLNIAMLITEKVTMIGHWTTITVHQN